MLSVNVASIQGLVNELQDMKRRKSQLILELQNLERDEFGVVQRLQIELDLASEISSNDHAANGGDGHTSKRPRCDLQANLSTSVPVHSTIYPPPHGLHHLSLPTSFSRPSSMPDSNKTQYLPAPSPSNAPQPHPPASNAASKAAPAPPVHPAWKEPPSGLPIAIQRQASNSRSLSTTADMDPSQVALRERQLQLAVKLRSGVGADVDPRSINMKALLKTGILAGEAVEYRKQSGTLACNSGVLTALGCVLCNCAGCKAAPSPPAAEISCSLFEEHSGSSMKRPADFIWLQRYNCTVKELIGLVQGVDLEHSCRICGHGSDRGELLCCDVCSSGFHGACLGIQTHSGRGPECPACKAKASGTPFSVAKGGSTLVTPKTEPLADRPLPSPDDPLSAPLPILHTAPAPPSSRPPTTTSPSLDSQPSEAIGASPLPGPSSREQAATPSPPPSFSPSPPLDPSPPPAASPPRPPPSTPLAPSAASRMANRNRRLFVEGGLQHGEAVRYVNAGEAMLEGRVHIGGGLTGILCACCAKVISCSQFENHAGFGQRRAPYDNIRTDAGTTLRQLADRLPSDPTLDPSSRPPTPLDEGVMSCEAAMEPQEAAEQLPQAGRLMPWPAADALEGQQQQQQQQQEQQQQDADSTALEEEPPLGDAVGAGGAEEEMLVNC